MLHKSYANVDKDCYFNFNSIDYKVLAPKNISILLKDILLIIYHIKMCTFKLLMARNLQSYYHFRILEIIYHKKIILVLLNNLYYLQPF